MQNLSRQDFPYSIKPNLTKKWAKRGQKNHGMVSYTFPYIYRTTH